MELFLWNFVEKQRKRWKGGTEGMDLGQLIATRRKELKLTLEAVGNAVGVTKGTVKKWESGDISNIHHGRLPKLASVLRIPLNQLVAECFPSESGTELFREALLADDTDEGDYYFSFPHPGADERLAIDERSYAPPPLLLRSETPIFNRENHEYGYYRMLDNSMINAGIRKDDTVFFRALSGAPREGKIILIKLADMDHHLLRRYYKEKDEIVLVPENPRFPSIRRKATDDYKILGEAFLLQTRID